MEIRVSIYHLGSRVWNRFAEFFSEKMGVYHVGIEVLGVEWSYGFCESGSGIFAVQPGKCSLGPFKESIDLGSTSLTVEEIISVLHNMAPRWMGLDYNITRKNCVRFCKEFLNKLDPSLELPAYTVSMTELGSRFAEESNKPSRPIITPEYIFGKSPEKRQMWIVAESIMRDCYDDMFGDTESVPDTHVSSVFPSILHSKKPIRWHRDPLVTVNRCIQAYHHLQRNRYQYLNSSSLRQLCH